MSSAYLSSLLGGSSLNHSFSNSQSFDDMQHSSSHAQHNSASQNAAALSRLLGHPSSPYTFDSTAASFLSSFISRPPSDAITTASVIPGSPSDASSAAASGMYPMPYPSGGMSAASLRLKSGSSCHQCKTNKDPPHLYFCSTKQDTATGKRNCRKKYCCACIARWYKQLGTSGMPGMMPPNGPGWSCPSCCGQCVCAACDRKKEKASRKAAEEGGADAAGENESVKGDAESDSHACSKGEGGSVSEVPLGVKRERSDSCEVDESRPTQSPPSKHSKMDISPPLGAVSTSAVAFSSSDQKDRSPSTLVLPRPPPGYNRLQSEPNMPAFASPIQPIRNVSGAQIAQAIVAPLPPHTRSAQSRSTPAPFQVPAVPLSASSSSSASSNSSSASTPLYFDPMQQEAVRAISRFYHSQHTQQQQHAQQLLAGKAYPLATPATAYEHMRRGSEDVPSLTNFSSSNSSSVSSPIANTPPTHYAVHEDAALAFALDSAPTAQVTAAANAAAGMQLKALPAQPLPMLTNASRALTVPVTNGETDRHTAVRAIQSIGLLNFDMCGPSPPTLSLAASPSLSPVVSVPSSPRSLNAWRSSLSLLHPSAQLLSSSPFDALTSDPFNPSPLFNPLLPLGAGSASTVNTPRNVGGHTPVQFWIKSGINSLCGTPRAGQLPIGAASGVGGRPTGSRHGSRGGSMGEMEFQALFN